MVLPDDFMEAVGYLPAEERDRAILGAAHYAMTEEEPDLDGAAMGMFLAAKRSIYKANRQSRGGSKGGSASPRPDGGEDPEAPAGQAPPCRRGAPAGGGDANPGKGSAEKGGPNLDQGSASKLGQGSAPEPCGEHNVTEHNVTERNGGGARARAAAEVIPFGARPSHPGQPPTLEEVRAYFGASCLRGDPEAFFLRYDEVGWVDAQGRAIVNWQSTALRWSRREPEFAQARADRDRAAATRRGEAPVGEAWRPAKSASQMLAEIEAAEAREGVAL